MTTVEWLLKGKELRSSDRIKVLGWKEADADESMCQYRPAGSRFMVL